MTTVTPVTMLRATIERSAHNRREAVLDIEYSDGGFGIKRLTINAGYIGSVTDALNRVGQTETNISARMRGVSPIPVRWA